MFAKQLNLLARDGNLCSICGTKMLFDSETRSKIGVVVPDNTLTIDHIVPLSKGGKNVLENYRLACYKCNVERGNKLIEKPTKSYRPINEIWDYLKKENEEHKRSLYATNIGNKVILRYRYKLKILSTV